MLKGGHHGATSTTKVMWLSHSIEWDVRDGRPTLKTGAAIWMDDGKPWAVFTAEDIVFNVDVQAYIRAQGL